MSVETPPPLAPSNLAALLTFLITLVIVIAAKLSIKKVPTNHRLIIVFDTYFIFIGVSLFLVTIYLAAPFLLGISLQIMYQIISGRIESEYPVPYQDKVQFSSKNFWVTVSFNMPLDNSSVKSNSVTLLNENSSTYVAGKVVNLPHFLADSVADKGGIRFIANSNQIKPDTIYRASLNTGLKYISGEEVMKDKWIFKTGKGLPPSPPSQHIQHSHISSSSSSTLKKLCRYSPIHLCLYL